jgi:shikimate kinase
MIILLIGYMGSGKTTVGKKLAGVLDFAFLDLDEYISEQEESSISSIFDEKGEIYFRKKESEYLDYILKSSENLVLALGGGTPCYGENMSYIKNNEQTISFYIKLPIQDLTNRLIAEKQKRPLIKHMATKDELTEFIGKHLFERSGFYSEADHTINAANKTVEEITEAIVLNLV